MNEIALALRGVGHRVGAAQILDRVDLDIRYGRVLALVGPNGAGKSTLLSVLTGDTAADGEVLLDGEPLRQRSARELSRMRSVLLQANQVSFSFTALDVVEMGRAPWIGTDRADSDAQIISAAMASTDVSHLAGRVYPSLSGGEQARVSLARVLAQDTPIVLLDEPTAALDLRHQEEVMRLAQELASAGRAVVVVLHDLSLAAAYADEVAMIEAGRVVGLGHPVDVFTEERITAVYQTPVRVLADPDTGRPIVLPRRRIEESAHPQS